MGKDRPFTRRFQQLASPSLREPVACTPAAGGEQGPVEHQVPLLRQRLLVPRLACADLAEWNAKLGDRCRRLAAVQAHPELVERTVAQVFREEPPRLLGVPAPLEAYQEQPVRVCTTARLADDTNRDSVEADRVGQTVMRRADAEGMVVVEAGEVVGEPLRQFGRPQVV